MAAAAADEATVFLETSLGTRLVVAFPASATTVADLKRLVSAEHAACFPQIGPIAVKSLQVKFDGALFYLTDSMAVDGAFRWVKGPWQLRAEARELQSHPLARADANGGSGDSEQSAGNPVVRASTRNTCPAVSQGGGNLAIGDGVSGTRQLDVPHEGVKRAPNQLKDEDTVPQESSEPFSVAGGSDTPEMDQQDQSFEHLEHDSGQRRDANAKTMLMGSSGFYFAAVGSDNTVDLQDQLREGVKHASGQHKDGNVMSMLQESSDLNLAAGASDAGAKNQLNTSHEDVGHASSLCENGNAKAVLQESSDLDVAAGEGETPSMNQLENSYKGVKHASGQCKDENVDAMLQKKSEDDVAAGESETSPMNELGKSYEGVKHASVQHEDGIVTIILDDSSDSDVAASESEVLPVNQLDTSHEDTRYASGQSKDGTVNIILQKRSDLDESAVDEDNSPMQGQQKDVIAEPTGAKCFRKEDKNDENNIANCDANISSLASSTVNTKLAEEKSSTIEQENLNSSPLVYNQGNCSHGMREKPSCSQKEPWTSDTCNGESSNNGSDIPPLVGSMDRDNSSNREVNAHRGDEEEPWIAGLCSGETSFKQTDGPHCTRSMKKGKKRPASNDQFLENQKHEVATSTVSTEQATCFKRRQHVVSVRKVPMSRAAKIYGFRC